MNNEQKTRTIQLMIDKMVGDQVKEIQDRLLKEFTEKMQEEVMGLTASLSLQVSQMFKTESSGQDIVIKWSMDNNSSNK